jgi:CBS domain-containing protein
MYTQTLEFIRTHPPFDCLTETELEEVSATLDSITVSPGEQILRQGGNLSRHLHLIGSGAVRLVRDGQVVQVLEDGDFFGYPSMISQDAPTADVVADESSTIYRIPEHVFQKLVSNQQFAQFFLKNLGARLRQYTDSEITSVRGELITPVHALIVRPPVTVDATASVAEAAKIMRRAWVDSALVLSNPPGIVTDHDFHVKVLAEELGPETPVQQVVSRPLKTLPADTPVHGALMFMLEENIHHLPISKDGEIVGIVTASDLLRHQAKSPLYMMRHLQNLESPEALARYSLEIAGMVENLQKGGLDITQIGRVIASVNDALIRRLLRMAEDELGPPPMPYSWIVFGSEGRMEQALLTDQDNALVYQTDSPEAKAYFPKLAQCVVDNLIKAGFPPCPGGYMATNWCKSIDDWVALFKGWLKKPDPQALMETGIFFDLRGVHGDLSLEPLENIVAEAGSNGIFMAQLARATIEFKPPLGFFRRIRADGGYVDLKKGGVAPIVGLARLYALEGNVRAYSTVDRLDGAVEAGTLSQEGAENLIELYRFVLQLRLREQLEDIRAGELPDNRVKVTSLSALENKHLKDAFLAIREMQEAASQRYSTNLLG